jgi:hypothetical protein
MLARVAATRAAAQDVGALLVTTRQLSRAARQLRSCTSIWCNWASCGDDGGPNARTRARATRCVTGRSWRLLRRVHVISGPLRPESLTNGVPRAHLCICCAIGTIITLSNREFDFCIARFHMTPCACFERGNAPHALCITFAHFARLQMARGGRQQAAQRNCPCC